MKLLSILIPTLPERQSFLNEMLGNLKKQIAMLDNPDGVEILIDDRPRGVSTGEKRNNLVNQAKGLYCWQIDDDDWIAMNALNLVMAAIDKGPDVIGINGWMTTDGANRINWEIRLGHEYKAVKVKGKEYYLRFPNHITPMKTEHARAVQFEHITWQEDYKWAVALRKLNVLKTQVVIDAPIYHYRCRTNK